MAERNNVFANDREIACKAADGISSSAFPDVCWSPPEPSAGPVPIPYANTAYARDTANGSTTVFISGKPIIKKDISYFKTSQGNEPATNHLGQGVITGVITGKAYFVSWSMDVKVEGQNVARHEDYMTHNHASKPGNTGAWLYLDTRNAKDCKAAKKRVDKACDIDKNEQKRFKNGQERANKRRKKKNKKPHGVRNKTWKDNHCKKLIFKPDLKEIQDRIEQIQKDAQSMLSDLKDEALKQAGDVAVDSAKHFGKRAATKHVVGLGCAVFEGIGAVVCEAGITVYNVLDGLVTTVGTLIDVIDVALDVGSNVDAVEKAIERIKAIKEALNDPEKTKELKEKILKDMQEAVKNDKCLQARKCMLVPYDKKKQENMREGEKGPGARGNLSTKLGLGDSRGCCPGQTGHHLIPGSWVKNKCSPYDHDAAPVVCMEGTGHSDGSHGEMHTGMNKVYDDALSAKVAQDNDGTVNIDEAIDMAARSHQEVYPKADQGYIYDSPCEEKCLKAQLKNYYAKLKCDNALDAKKIGRDGGRGDDDSAR